MYARGRGYTRVALVPCFVFRVPCYALSSSLLVVHNGCTASSWILEQHEPWSSPSFCNAFLYSRSSSNRSSRIWRLCKVTNITKWKINNNKLAVIFIIRSSNERQHRIILIIFAVSFFFSCYFVHRMVCSLWEVEQKNNFLWEKKTRNVEQNVFVFEKNRAWKFIEYSIWRIPGVTEIISLYAKI